MDATLAPVPYGRLDLMMLKRARFYSITRTGRKQLATEVDGWTRAAAMVGRLLEDTP